MRIYTKPLSEIGGLKTVLEKYYQGPMFSSLPPPIYMYDILGLKGKVGQSYVRALRTQGQTFLNGIIYLFTALSFGERGRGWLVLPNNFCYYICQY